LCNIFPPDLVRLVMKRNPHMTDAQQLAAAILVEKSQLGYWKHDASLWCWVVFCSAQLLREVCYNSTCDLLLGREVI
jgi:hypothetical protein